MGEFPPSLHRDSFYLLMPVREGVGKVFCLGQWRVTGAQAAVFSIRQNPKVTKEPAGHKATSQSRARGPPDQRRAVRRRG